MKISRQYVRRIMLLCDDGSGYRNLYSESAIVTVVFPERYIADASKHSEIAHLQLHGWVKAYCRMRGNDGREWVKTMQEAGRWQTRLGIYSRIAGRGKMADKTG